LLRSTDKSLVINDNKAWLECREPRVKCQMFRRDPIPLPAKRRKAVYGAKLSTWASI